ncbi:hypothetical protein Daura_47095 [Dactylosporangium aurantiacum]|uniref:Uncharacterized protein n=1 Tax=Dactylosporangium aurantiacum TaxID=35754 RepID=A0A9Q9IIG5_9ACTN|nr:hypothetical protein [Dactylosporangium aurantiacum]MDG6105492.1 hypothetical protein [Dactylosporangium aurantiacum]UWZ53974.1 hypothetical protein Daura_47095 [Dactylosporangium aurantiacum]
MTVEVRRGGADVAPWCIGFDYAAMAAPPALGGAVRHWLGEIDRHAGAEPAGARLPQPPPVQPPARPPAGDVRAGTGVDRAAAERFTATAAAGPGARQAVSRRGAGGP